MSNPAKSPTAQPAVIVFGVSAIGKPRAGTFKGSDVPAARKAAAKLGFKVIDLTDEAGLALAAKVPAGRIGAAPPTTSSLSSTRICTRKSRPSEIRSQKNGQGQTNGGSATSPEAKSPRLPRNWDDIKVGDLSLGPRSRSPRRVVASHHHRGEWRFVQTTLARQRSRPAASEASCDARLDLPQRCQDRRQRRAQARPEAIGRQVGLPCQLVPTCRRSNRPRQGGRADGAMVGSQDRQGREGSVHAPMAGLSKAATDRTVAIEPRLDASRTESGAEFLVEHGALKARAK